MLSRIIKNIFSLAIADLGNKLLLFVFFLLLARYLGPYGFGVFSAAIAVISILFVVVDTGTSPLIAREIARDQQKIASVFPNIIFFKISFSIVIILFSWIVIKILGFSSEKINLVLILFPSIIFFTLTQSFNAIFQATERMAYIPLGKIVDSSILLLGFFILVKIRAGTLSFAGLYTIAMFCLFLYGFLIFQKKFAKFNIVCDTFFLRDILKQTLPFALSTIFSTFYYWNGPAIIGLLKNDIEAGFYNAPFRFVLGTTFIPIAFVGALYPILSKAFISSKEKIENIFFNGLKYMTIIAIPVCIFTVVLSERIVYFFYGSDYVGSISLLRILIWWAGIVYLNAVLAHFFYSTNQQTVIAKQTFFAAIINLILNLILIKKIGASGACFSIIIAELSSFLYLMCRASKSIPLFTKQLKTLIGISIKAIVASVLPVVFIIMFKQIHLIILSAIAVSIYAIIFYINKGLSTSDKNLAKNLWLELKLIIYGQR